MKAIQAGQRQQIVATVLYARLHSKRGNGAKLDLGPGIASKVMYFALLSSFETPNYFGGYVFFGKVSIEMGSLVLNTFKRMLKHSRKA